MTYYEHITPAGTFRIAPFNEGWATYFNEERLDWHHTPQLALDDLTGGHGHWPSSGVDPSTLGLPTELADWRQRRS